MLVARLDNVGDVLLTGPLVRACAATTGRPVTFMAGPRGAAAASLLPGVGRVIAVDAPWIDAAPGPVRREAVDDLVEQVAAAGVSSAAISTSFHQSPLPLALLLRLAGVDRIGAVSVDYPGSLLDVRHQVPDDIHEVRRSLSLGAAMGCRLPPGDDGRLRVQGHPQRPPVPGLHPGGYVVVHPGASVSARAWHATGHREVVERIAARGLTPVVTGTASEKQLTAGVAGRHGVDLGGRVDLAGLAAVIEGAAAVVTGNTGPAHLAAAVATPVVSVYAPTVPSVRWRPWMVPHVLLGDQAIACAGCRARDCPVAGHPCVDAAVTPAAVMAALDALLSQAGCAPGPGDGAVAATLGAAR